MAPLPTAQFQHRNNGNGSIDSICTVCFLTIASAKDEEELAGYEETHICAPIRLFAIANGALPQSV